MYITHSMSHCEFPLRFYSFHSKAWCTMNYASISSLTMWFQVDDPGFGCFFDQQKNRTVNLSKVHQIDKHHLKACKYIGIFYQPKPRIPLHPLAPLKDASPQKSATGFDGAVAGAQILVSWQFLMGHLVGKLRQVALFALYKDTSWKSKPQWSRWDPHGNRVQ